MPRLVLWDIDHTLIENAGVSKRIYAAAFEILTGVAATYVARTDGRTDQDIMSQMLEAHGASSPPWPVIQRSLELAGVRHRRLLGERGSVLPGVRAVLTALGAMEGVVQSIVTGNIKANAVLKLEAQRLTSWLDLDIGGYGSDDRDRSKLVALAKRRAAAKNGYDYGEDANAVVIGDTPRDVEGGQGGGARVLAVASGLHTYDELVNAGANCVMSDLSDTSAVLDYVLAAGPRGTPRDTRRHNRT
jgi:phosphoglycolate phosphatase-like HAD superfamily hydrolase